MQSDLQAGIEQEVRADEAGMEYLRAQGMPREQIWAGATAALEKVFAANPDDPVAEPMKQARLPAISELVHRWGKEERHAAPVMVAQRGG
jgi:hypothetical protein